MSTINSQPDQEVCYFQTTYDSASVLQRQFLQDNAPENIKTEWKEVQGDLNTLNDSTVGQAITRHDSMLGVTSLTEAEIQRRFLTNLLNEFSLAEHTRQSTMSECPVYRCVQHHPDAQSKDLFIDDSDKSAPAESGTRLDDNSTVRD